MIRDGHHFFIPQMHQVIYVAKLLSDAPNIEGYRCKPFIFYIYQIYMIFVCIKDFSIRKNNTGGDNWILLCRIIKKCNPCSMRIQSTNACHPTATKQVEIFRISVCRIRFYKNTFFILYPGC